METPELDRRHTARTMRNRNLLGAVIAYLAFVPLPMVLMGNWQLAGVFIILSAIYVASQPSILRPSREDVDEVMRDGNPCPSRRSVYVNGTHSGQVINVDPAGQAAADRLYGGLVHGGEASNVLSPDSQLYGLQHNQHNWL